MGHVIVCEDPVFMGGDVDLGARSCPVSKESLDLLSETQDGVVGF
jgi:hypothetical protein